MQVIKDPFLTAHDNKVGKRLAASQEAQESSFPFSFEVVTDPTINAFALPGGPMFINTGLLTAVDNEAQLARVMGHAMSQGYQPGFQSRSSSNRRPALPAKWVVVPCWVGWSRWALG
jgi:predicted Zn-dependent protease